MLRWTEHEIGFKRVMMNRFDCVFPPRACRVLAHDVLSCHSKRQKIRCSSLADVDGGIKWKYKNHLKIDIRNVRGNIRETNAQAPGASGSTQVRSAQLNSAQFNSAELNSARLNSAHLNSVQLSSTQLNSASPNSAQLSSTQFSSAQRN